MGDQAANISLQNTSCFTFLLFLQKQQPLEVYRYDMFVTFMIICLFIRFFILYLQPTLVLHQVVFFHNLSSWLQKETLKNFIVHGNHIFSSIAHTQPAGSCVSLYIYHLFIPSQLQALYLFYIIMVFVPLINHSGLPHISTNSPQVVDITTSIHHQFDFIHYSFTFHLSVMSSSLFLDF